MPRIIHVKSAHKPRAGKKHHVCEKCGSTILPRTSYKHVTIKTGPRSSYTRYRCGDCPTWQNWELSNALWARLAKVSYDFSQEISEVGDTNDAEQALSNAAEEIRAIAEEKRESADNIESGFGHPTTMSEELTDIADQLESWADDVENSIIECIDYPEAEETDCEECGSTGTADDGTSCEQCNGEGVYTPDEPTEEQVEEWRDEVIATLTDILDNPPVG